MKAIDIRAVGTAPVELLDRLSAELARLYQVSCRVYPKPVEVEDTLDTERNQYHSTRILAKLQTLASPGVRVLGITEYDLYVPVLTFVFGEAQLGGSASLVSLHRLREEYYGLPADQGKLIQRLVVEAVHELGHTFGLRHCGDWRCAMASTHSVERLDLKQALYCARCAPAMLASVS